MNGLVHPWHGQGSRRSGARLLSSIAGCAERVTARGLNGRYN
jgi:hypothetical protein